MFAFVDYKIPYSEKCGGRYEKKKAISFEDILFKCCALWTDGKIAHSKEKNNFLFYAKL